MSVLTDVESFVVLIFHKSGEGTRFMTYTYWSSYFLDYILSEENLMIITKIIHKLYTYTVYVMNHIQKETKG